MVGTSAGYFALAAFNLGGGKFGSKEFLKPRLIEGVSRGEAADLSRAQRRQPLGVTRLPRNTHQIFRTRYIQEV